MFNVVSSSIHRSWPFEGYLLLIWGLLLTLFDLDSCMLVSFFGTTFLSACRCLSSSQATSCCWNWGRDCPFIAESVSQSLDGVAVNCAPVGWVEDHIFVCVCVHGWPVCACMGGPCVCVCVCVCVCTSVLYLWSLENLLFEDALLTVYRLVVILLSLRLYN